MEIRPATPADAEAIARVQVETWRSAYTGMIAGHVLDAMTVERTAARWATYFGTPGVAVWLAVDGGEAAGFVCVGPPREDDVPAAGEVYAIYVRPAAQRRGLGAALLGTAEDRLGDGAGVLWVLTANAPARAFYEARGWVPEGTERGIDVGGDVVAELRYRRSGRAGPPRPAPPPPRLARYR